MCNVSYYYHTSSTQDLIPQTDQLGDLHSFMDFYSNVKFSDIYIIMKIYFVTKYVSDRKIYNLRMLK